jgi:maleate cis-trans isomerase
MCPRGVEVYATRIAFQSNEEGLRGMRTHVLRASLELSSEELSDVIVFGCTVGSFLEGGHRGDAIGEEIAAATGTPAITTAQAVVEALRAVRVTRIAVATPYTRRINELEATALRDCGFEVVAIQGYHEDVPDSACTNRMIGEIHEEDTYRFARSVDREDAECLFLSCTNWRTLGILRDLEQSCRKPVVSSNLCNMWLALRRLGVSHREDELHGTGWGGTLMRSLASGTLR